MPVEAGMTSNETSSKAAAVLTSKEAKSSNSASLESKEGVQPDVSLQSMSTDEAQPDDEVVKKNKDGPYERVEIKDSNGGSYALVGSKEDMENPHMDMESQKITDFALELRETIDGLQIEMASKVSNGGSHELWGSKEDKDNLHMDAESQKITAEVHHVMHFKETSDQSTDNVETQNICDQLFDDEEVKHPSRTLSLYVQCRETNDSVIREDSDAPCSDTGSREMNDSLMVCPQVCDQNYTETVTTKTDDGTHHATDSKDSTSIPHIESKETHGIFPDRDECDVSSERSQYTREAQDTCNKSPNETESSNGLGKSTTDVEVTGIAGEFPIATDTLNTNSESCLFSAEESDANCLSVERHLLDSAQDDESHPLLEGSLQEEESEEKASTQGTGDTLLNVEDEEENVLTSSSNALTELNFNCQLEQNLPSTESDGSTANSVNRSDQMDPSLDQCLLTSRGFHDLGTICSDGLVQEHTVSPRGLETPDSVSHATEEGTNLCNEKLKEMLNVNTVDLGIKSVDTVVVERSVTESPITVERTSSNIFENEMDHEEIEQDLSPFPLSASIGSPTSRGASLQSQRGWSLDVLSPSCLLHNGKGGALVVVSDDMHISPSLSTFGGEELQPGEGEVNCLSPHDPMILLSSDNIKEDLEGAESTDGDSILQPVGDMEKNVQETKCHDMGLPLELTAHDCTSTVFKEAREGKIEDMQGDYATIEHPTTVSSEEGNKDHLTDKSHEGDVIHSPVLASQMHSLTDGPLSSLTPEEPLQENRPVIQVTVFENDSPASHGDGKELLPPHVEPLSTGYIDLETAEFPSHNSEVTGDQGDATAAVLNSNCSPIIFQAEGGASVESPEILGDGDQSEKKGSMDKGGGVVACGGENTEPICEGTITPADMTSTCVDDPSMDTAHPISDESPPTILEIFNPMLLFGHSPEEPGQYDFQIQYPQPSDSEPITEEATSHPQTPPVEWKMRKTAMDISGDRKMDSEGGESTAIEESSAHQVSTLSLIDKITITGSLSNSNAVLPLGFTRTAKFQQFEPVSPKSKFLYQQVAVSEEPKTSFPEASAITSNRASLVRKAVCTQQPSRPTSGRWMVREQVEGVQLRAGSLKEGRPVDPLLKQHHDLGHPPLEKSFSWAGQSPVNLDEEQLGTATDSRSQEDLAYGNSRSRDWHRKAVRRPSSAFGILQDEETKAEEDLSSSDPVTLREKNLLDVSSSIKRRRSRLINSSRLLYQEYSDVVLTQEIQRQRRAETFTEDGEPSSPRMRRKPFSAQDSYLQRLSISSNASLWQDIPMIRGSSMLLNMTRDEQKLQEAKFELIMSEASYLRSLNVAVDHFQYSPDLQALLSNQERQWLFSKLQEVRDVSSNFLFDLEEKFEDDIYTFNVCDVVLSHAEQFRKVYLPYVTNQSYQDQTFQQLLTGNARFRQVLEKLECDPVCQRLSLKSFLILPFQRITRLKLLVQNILKRTQLGSKEEAEATQAHNALEKLIKDCNENIQRMRSTEELIFLSQKIQFECKIFPLISQSRRLVKHGELVSLEYTTSLSFKWKLMTRPIYLHLFTDCLLLSRRREGGRFLVFDHARASRVRGERCEMKLHANHKNIFRLFLLENNQGRKVEFLFRTETQSEKLRWIAALSPVRKETDFLACHDYPQVQCIKPYKARENDEISLEKADVIMVTQESNDGWLEGVRLSDGDRGWFPLQHVDQISSRHVRLRNLKEEQRIQNAKANLLPSRRK